MAVSRYVNALRSEHRLILMDHRGHGASDKPPDPKAHRIEEYHDDVLAVLDAAGCDRVVFVGYSDGSKVGATLAESNPGRVFALVDIDGLEPRDLTDPMSRDRQVRHDFAQIVREHGLADVFRAAAERQDYRGPKSFLENMAATDPEMYALELEEWRQWNGPASVLRRLKDPGALAAGRAKLFRGRTRGDAASEPAIPIAITSGGRPLWCLRQRRSSDSLSPGVSLDLVAY